MQTADTTGHTPWLQRAAWSLLEIPVATGLAFAVLIATFKLGCLWTHCVDVSGLPWLLLGALLGLVTGVAYWIIAWRRGTRWRARFALDAVAATLGVAAVVLPQFCWGSQCGSPPPPLPARPPSVTAPDTRSPPAAPRGDSGNLAPIPR